MKYTENNTFAAASGALSGACRNETPGAARVKTPAAVPVAPADIMLPSEDVDLTKWASVACDQYTKDPAYWDRVYRLTRGVPSTAHMMLPEIFLGEDGVDGRINGIYKTMDSYIQGGCFRVFRDSMILTRRKFASGKIRTGLVAAIDLAGYSYAPDSGTPVRATEETIVERLPARMAIRSKAALEMPHIMILIDDPGQTVIEPLEAEAVSSGSPVYDFELMENGGHITGYVLSGPEKYGGALAAIEKLSDPDVFTKKYGLPEGTPVLSLAVGDGNHSLASARALYDAAPSPLNRYALAEIVNIHSPGIEFEPIHRIITGAAIDDVEKAAADYFGDGLTVVQGPVAGPDALSGRHAVTAVSGGTTHTWLLSKSIHLLAVGALTGFVDEYIASHPGSDVDYIHGSNEAAGLAGKGDAVAFLLPGMDKSDLFPTVIRYGKLPRKTFSMGTADEKRYYLECRMIR